MEREEKLVKENPTGSNICLMFDLPLTAGKPKNYIYLLPIILKLKKNVIYLGNDFN